MPVKTYSKIPLTVQAIQFTDRDDAENVKEVVEFTNYQFKLHNDEDKYSENALNKGIEAYVYDELHDTWVGVKHGDYIIKGIKGEFYPHDGALFPQAYIESWQQEAFDIFNEVPPQRT
jgi:hypothetical protein